MGDLVSIIVPIYNAEKYLSKCIRSIINQTYTNLEIILVDDGSTDNSLNICLNFAKKDKRIRVITQDNAGVSAARNQGINVLTGNYICFVDSDDWISKKAIEQLYNTFKKEKVQMSSVGTKRVQLLKTEKMPCNSEIINVNDCKRMAKYIYIEGNQISSPCAKLFVADIIKNNNLRYDTSMKYAEDAEFVFNYLKYCNRIAMTDSYAYFYNGLNSNSSIRKYYPQKNQWIYRVMKKRIALFGDNFDEEIKIMSMQYLLLWLPRLFSEAAYYNDNKDEGIKKVREICELFLPYIWDDLLMNNTVGLKYVETYMKYRSFLLSGNYTKIYDCFTKLKVEPSKNCVRKIIKKMILFIRENIIFHF